ncbi:MAG TPA: hypothetical protein VFE47_26305 [Tepidisphaeraceae bacterium]|jgi:protein disulfide-isomerase|nr:hypothetical protein [Tepidisphaeraceae bacterium]
MHSIRIPLLAATICACLVSCGGAAELPKPKPVLTKWIPLWENASSLARKEKKPILAYFCSSDGEAYTGKLEKEVLNTEMFREWAAQNVILFKVDFPREKPLSGNMKSQAERLKKRYSLIYIPTFILMDYSGNAFARGGWDQAKLRDEEPKENPKAWINWLDTSIKNKPPDELIVKQKNLTECIAYGKKHFISSVILINHDQTPRTMTAKDDITHNQTFVKFMNRNVAYCEVEWPFDSDTSLEANTFRQFATAQNLSTTAPLQLCVLDMQTNKVNFRLTAIDPLRADIIVNMIESKLPKLDYNSGWITDWHMANAIAQQQKRYIFICFTSMDAPGVNFSQKIFDEIFKTDEFKKYAIKHLVTIQVDFPTIAKQEAPLVAQNKMLAQMYNIKGFPSVFVLNPQGQKIGDAKYMKGGPEEFIKQLDAAVKNDEERRAFLAGER